MGFQPPNSASVLGCSLNICAECLEPLAFETVACSMSAALPRAAEEAHTENCCFSMHFIAHRYLMLDLMLKMSLVRQEKCRTTVGADFS